MPLSKIDSDSLNTPITAVDLAYTGTLTGGTGIVNLGSGQVYKDASGNVGVGVTPAFKLDVSGGGSTAKFNTLDTYDGGASISTWQKVGRRAGTGTNAYINTVHSGSDAVSALTWAFGTSGTGTETARISSTGNVSVGSPFDLSYKMALVSTSTGSPALYLRSTASGDVGTAQLRLIKADSTNTTSQIFIQFVIDGNNVNSGQINANGASQAAFGSFSDARLKENIVDLPLQLSNIMALRPVEFDYKDGCGHQIGFIAQEMQQVYPDAIGVGENDMLTITGWSKTEARLVKAIQELKAIVDAQGAEIAALKGTP